MMTTLNKSVHSLRVVASSLASTFSNSTTYWPTRKRWGSLFLVCLLLFYTSFSQAQGLAKQWDKRFGGSGDDYLSSAISTADGGYLLIGTSFSGMSGDKSEYNQSSIGYLPFPDYWVVKIDSQGVKQWDKRYGGFEDERLISAISTSDGGYLLAGYSSSGIGGDKSEPSQGRYDYWIVKIDSQGVKQWDKRFGGIYDDYLSSAIVTADGGYLLAGGSNSVASGDRSENSRGQDDYWVVKIDSQGVKQWDKRFGSTLSDHPGSVMSTADGGYLLAGRSYSGIGGDKSEASQGQNDYWVVKIDTQGIKQWDKRFGGTADDVLTSAIPTVDGGHLLAGRSNSGISGDRSENSRGGYDNWVVKIDTQGVKQWDKRLGGNDRDYVESVVQAPNGDYLLNGFSLSGIGGDKSEASQGEDDYWVVAIDQLGTKKWDKSFGGTAFDVLEATVFTPDGGYLFAGYTLSGIGGDKTQPSRGNTDYWVLKVGAPVLVPPTSTIRINAGASAFTTADGKLYQTDAYFSTPSKVSPRLQISIANTVDDELYRTDRVGSEEKGSFQYQIPVPNGTYQVSLHFAETYFTEAGKRMMSVAAEGVPKLVNYDIFASVGYKAADVKTYTVNVADGFLTLDFSATVNRPKINAIEIVPASAIARQQPDESLFVEAGTALSVAPNPISNKATVSFVLPKDQSATVELYDLQGRRLQTLWQAEAKAGMRQDVELEASGWKPGVYIVRLVSQQGIHFKKVIISK